jgi:hypothetical protein
MTTHRNFTPHQINLNDGRTFSSEGCARVSAAFTEIEGDTCRQTFGDVQGLPEWEEGTRIIVSAMVMAASDRTDLVAPATGHPLAIRNEKGHIMSVPCFITR